MKPTRFGRAGFSLVEMLMALGVAGVVLFAAYQLLSSSTRLEDQLATQLGLQSDAQRALTRIIQDIQEGIAVVQPLPGGTLPHLVVRDKVSGLVFYALSKQAGEEGYRLIRARGDASGGESAEVLRGVAHLAFTAPSDGAVMVHLVLGHGARRYAVHTEIRLRNRDALEFE